MRKKAAVVMLISIILLSVAKDGLACKGSQILYEDKFATMDPSWGTPSQKQTVSSGKFIIQPEANKSSTALNQGIAFEDMDACVTVTLAKSDDPAYGGGLVFWAKDFDDYYYLQLSGNGYFQIARWANGRFLYPVPWRENASVKQGVGQTNQLEVITKGNQATVYINGTEVVTIKGQPPQGGGLIGLKGDSSEKSQSIWEFSDLKITKP
jgi:hypothetical protein